MNCLLTSLLVGCPLLIACRLFSVHWGLGKKSRQSAIRNSQFRIPPAPSTYYLPSNLGFRPFSREAPFLGKRVAEASGRPGWRIAERLDLRRAILRLARLPSFWFKKRPLFMG